MGFKNWPVWLKGGAISLGVGLILFFIGLLLVSIGMSLDCPKGEGVCDTGIISIIGGLSIMLFIWPFRLFDINLVLEFILSIFQLFIIGVIIGWIISKLKSKKKK